MVLSAFFYFYVLLFCLYSFCCATVSSIILLDLLFYCISMTLSAEKVIKGWTHQLRLPFYIYSSVCRHRSSFFCIKAHARVFPYFFGILKYYTQLIVLVRYRSETISLQLLYYIFLCRVFIVYTFLVCGVLSCELVVSGYLVGRTCAVVHNIVFLYIIIIHTSPARSRGIKSTN
ncbi:unnamed protein product [Aphis gossypii]|uniref:Uncharacterized protein n=1 Tax=Aphis gossypii TaxID=80765 RepID=A0A9P0IRZ0_APHGO|nr:unnamed protein product [Aphis gossypii]